MIQEENMFIHFEVVKTMLRKVVSEHMTRVKNSEDSLKPICMIKNVPLWVFDFVEVLDNKAYIEDYIKSIQHQNEVVTESTSKWWRTWL